MSAIQIKHVPEDLHRRLRERARLQGTTLSRYALGALERDLAIPNTREWLRRLAADEPATNVTAADITQTIRAGRAERDEHLLGGHADRD